MALPQLPELGKPIAQIVGPTFALYLPLLQKNAETIRSVKKETFQYGPEARHQLDVYLPSKPNNFNGRKPVLMFEYGGGLVNGHRSLPMGDGLCHANVGAFFALKLGYTVVIADYRLMSHGAKFPSGGEDIALAVEWVSKNPMEFSADAIDLFIMGNSAGGIHLSTFLLDSQFAGTRSSVLSGHGTRLRGAILLSVPFHFRSAEPGRAEVLSSYFGNVDDNSPLGLLKSARKQHTPLDFVKNGTRILVLNGELDPENECLMPRDDFITEWMQMSDNESRCALAVDTMIGHNHISPFLSLGTDTDEEEAWGYQVAAFCDAIRKFVPHG